jgi:AraC-like DNA-binding protein
VLASFEHIVPEQPLTWRITTLVAPAFQSMWHFHPEFELTYIREGHGTRLVGDSIGDYSPGNLTLIGPELPHTYVSTPGGHSHSAVVVQFRRDFLGETFFDNPTFEAVSDMLAAASRGLSFRAENTTFARLETAPPDEKTVELLSLLVSLAGRQGLQLASERQTPALNRATARRIEAMVTVIHADFGLPLTLERIAAAAHLSPSSASRLFARSTGSKISVYLNVVRVNAACRLLRDTDRAVASIAGECGFANLSNFNRRFKELKGETPRSYRQRFEL